MITLIPESRSAVNVNHHDPEDSEQEHPEQERPDRVVWTYLYDLRKKGIRANGYRWLSRNKLAKLLGVHRRTVDFWEWAERAPSRELMEQIAALFECDLGELYKTVPPTKPRKSVSASPLYGDGQNITESSL